VVDNVSPDETEQVSPPVMPPVSSRRPSFFATDTGKVIIAAVAVFLLLVVVGVAAFFYFMQAPDILVEVPQKPGTAVPGQSDEETPEAAEAPAEVPLSDVFVFRNIFAPSVKAPAPPKDSTTNTNTNGGGSSTGGSSTGGSSVGANTLLVQSIQTQDGELVATVAWNGKTYDLRKGDTIPGSPWKLVDITESVATFIYGDSSPIALPIGTSISK
jgi:type IV pilus biogenesis protein PilP